MKKILILCLILFDGLLFAQTPYDSFAPEAWRPMLGDDATLTIDVQNESVSDSVVEFVIVDISAQQVLLVNSSNQVLDVMQVEEDDVKWLSPDPMMDKYPSNSPYMYCNGNPIVMIDPDGMDDYSMNSDGDIVLLSKTDYLFDRLYVINATGEISQDNYITIHDQSLLPELSQMSHAIGKSGQEVAQLFLFVAANSNVEWSFSGYSNGKYRRYVINTDHVKNHVTSAFDAVDISERKVFFTIHSHPGVDGTLGASTPESSGGQHNDMKTIRDRYNRFLSYNQKLPYHYVYHQNSGNLYYYTPWKSNTFIRNVTQYPHYSGLNFLIP